MLRVLAFCYTDKRTIILNVDQMGFELRKRTFTYNKAYKTTFFPSERITRLNERYGLLWCFGVAVDPSESQPSHP